jgi:hypothetical protein
MINLNNVVDIINTKIPQLKGKYNIDYIQNSNSFSDGLNNLTIGPDKELLFIINTFDLKDNDLICLKDVLKFCNISELMSRYYPQKNNTLYHLSYDVSSLQINWDMEKLRNQLSPIMYL